MTKNIKDEFQFALDPIDLPRASEAIYEHIQKKIISGEIKPGERLPSERVLMDILKRSRPTIREALRMLERSGLIKTIPGSKGAVVTELSAKSIEQSLQNMIMLDQISNEDLLEYRTVTGVAFAGLAAKRRTDEDLQKMRGIINTAETLINDFRAFIQYDILFHEAFAAAAKNKISSSIDNVLSSLVSQTLIELYSSSSQQAIERMISEALLEHKGLYSAIEQGDVSTAKALMKVHLRSFKSRLNENKAKKYV